MCFPKSITYLKSAREAFLHITISATRTSPSAIITRRRTPTVPRALSVRTTYPALGNYALALIHLKRPEHALKKYETLRALTDDPEQRALAYHNMGRIYDLIMKDQEAGEKILSPSPGS